MIFIRSVKQMKNELKGHLCSSKQNKRFNYFTWHIIDNKAAIEFFYENMGQFNKRGYSEKLVHRLNMYFQYILRFEVIHKIEKQF
jgi:hypothetical protein